MYHAWQRGNASIIEVDTDLDIASSPALTAAIDLASQSVERCVIVSLESCSFCDSTGLGALVNAKKRLGAKFLLVLPSDSRLNRVFNVTGLTTHLTPFASLAEAIDSSNITTSAA